MASGKDVEPQDVVYGESQDIDPVVLQMGAPAGLSDSDLRNITSFDDAVQAAAAVHGEVVNYAEKYGTGFQPIAKAQLVEKTCVLLEWRFNSGDYGTFVSAVAVAKDGTKGIINDGSQGIRRQLAEITAEDGIHGGLMISHGLSRSTYPICPGMDGKCGAPRPHTVHECPNCGDLSERRAEGETFYLDMRE